MLGSRGHNRFIDNQKGGMRVSPNRMTAQHNWWDGGAPMLYDSDGRPTDDAHVLVDPVLPADPR